jgi:hypothetical protein
MDETCELGRSVQKGWKKSSRVQQHPSLFSDYVGNSGFKLRDRIEALGWESHEQITVKPLFSR